MYINVKKGKIWVKNEDKLFKKITVTIRIAEFLVTEWVEIISSYGACQKFVQS